MASSSEGVDHQVPTASILGYPSLASFIANDRDHTASVYQRFDRLAARNLLYLQSELAELQERLDAIDAEDARDGASLRVARSWNEVKRRSETEPTRMRLIKEVREAMKEYRQALLAESRTTSLPPPDPKTFKAFRYEFFHGKPGDPSSFTILAGRDGDLYNDIDELVALHVPEQQDRLSTLFQDYLGFLFSERKPVGATTSSRVEYASGRRISALVSYLSTILAAIVLIVAIVVLYKVRSPEAKLGLVGVFTVVFAASVGVLTNGRRAEVFGATAAYAAVLVVFISGEFGGT